MITALKMTRLTSYFFRDFFFFFFNMTEDYFITNFPLRQVRFSCELCVLMTITVVSNEPHLIIYYRTAKHKLFLHPEFILGMYSIIIPSNSWSTGDFVLCNTVGGRGG